MNPQTIFIIVAAIVVPILGSGAIWYFLGANSSRLSRDEEIHGEGEGG